ncbi:antibiotic biosynthesis monooxygenase family protein [Dactylosporangium sp. NPDC048998]|uniref:antibiotic biosynthesis monooxygenase family protein n=1 Tax=Dactylosporangium sp. NPDC048998 TaxID=3363976 RepID=UPI003714BF72
MTVVFVNTLRVTGSAEDLERIYADVAAFFSAQPGLLRYQLLRSTGDPSVYVNIAEWRDLEAFRTATSQEAFRTALRVSAVSTGEPHVCDVVFAGAGPGEEREPRGPGKAPAGGRR